MGFYVLGVDLPQKMIGWAELKVLVEDDTVYPDGSVVHGVKEQHFILDQKALVRVRSPHGPLIDKDRLLDYYAFYARLDGEPSFKDKIITVESVEAQPVVIGEE